MSAVIQPLKQSMCAFALGRLPLQTGPIGKRN